MDHIKLAFDEARVCLDQFVSDEENFPRIAQFSAMLVETFRAGAKVMSCGNGGSMSDAMHFAEEWSGRFRNERPPMAAFAFSDPGHMTCVANDYGFHEVFARQVQALGKTGDILLLLSTSGNSPNLLRAAETARKVGVRTVGLLGRGGGALLPLCDLPILVPGRASDRIQELHIKIIHAVIEATERALFPGLYPRGK
ncbi:MAG: SIS domain-containing protein [Ignavibacteriae bacterium]|nr:SIS domain-containing protein [Ignavibacteriota bacterium]